MQLQDTNIKSLPANSRKRSGRLLRLGTAVFIPFLVTTLILFPVTKSEAQGPFVFIGGDDWQPPADPRMQPLPADAWTEYIRTWEEDFVEGEPYPPNEFLPAEPPTGGLYVWEGGGGPQYPESPGLVMYWGTEPLDPGSFSSAYYYVLGEEPPGFAAQPPFNLSNMVMSLTVTPPQFGPAGQINSVSFGVQDSNGLYRSWHWNTGPLPAPIPWNVPTAITVNLSQVGINASTPIASGYASNPAFNITSSQALVADENALWVGGPNPIPPPGGAPGAAWNYWHSISLAPLGGPGGGGQPGIHGPVSFSVSGPVAVNEHDGPPVPGTAYYQPPWAPNPPLWPAEGPGPYGTSRVQGTGQAIGIQSLTRPGDVNDYLLAGIPSEADIFQSEPDQNPAASPSGTNNQIIQGNEMGLLQGSDNIDAYTFGEDFFNGGQPSIDDNPPVEEILWEGRENLPTFFEPVVFPGGVPIIFYFSVDPWAIGLQGTSVRNEATAQGVLNLPAGPVGNLDEEPVLVNWNSNGEGAGDVYFASPITAPTINFLDHDELPMALLGPRPAANNAEDDLDALEHVGTNAAGQPGNTHDRVNPIAGTHPPDLGSAGAAFHEPNNNFPLIFSIDRHSYGAPGSAADNQVNNPLEGASGDLFVAVTIPPGHPFAGTHTNLLLIDEGQLGLMPHDDLDAVVLRLLIDPVDLATRINQALGGFVDPVANNGYGFSIPLVNAGEAFVGFSVDSGSIGLAFTAVDFECRVDGLGPVTGGSGVMEQAGDIFYSDLSSPVGGGIDPGTGLQYGQNYLWFEEFTLGLDSGAWSFFGGGPSGNLADAPDDLNALDSLDEEIIVTEACCFSDGTCQDLTSTQCANLGGVPSPGPCLGDNDGDGYDDACPCVCDADQNNDGVVDLFDFAAFLFCFPSATTPPECRWADFDCDGDVDIEDFQSFHCQFYGFPQQVCCEEETGACCLSTDECRQVSLSECDALGGTYEGDGTGCGALVPEACCLPDGTCQMADPTCCVLELGGTPQGEGEVCTATRACCLDDGTCIEVDPLCCDEMGGTALPNQINCIGQEVACCLDDYTCIDADPICCEQIYGGISLVGETCEDTEACCLPDGTCVQLNAVCCSVRGGDPQGPGTVCLGDADGNNVDEICEPERACCLPDNTCIDLQPFECLAQGGTPQAEGDLCTATRACCLDDGTCIEVDPLCCEEMGGTALPNQINCIGQEVACCLDDNTCIDADPICCENIYSGIPLVGETCANTEACCLPDGTCVDINATCCIVNNGTPQGPGTVCLGDTDGNNVDEICEPERACCLPDNTCAELQPFECIAQGGTPQAPGTVCTQPEPCCLPDGTCEMLDPECCDDANGVPSPIGSNICLGDNDGTGIDDACEIQQPQQACCLPNGTCQVLTHNQCVAAGGDPQGPQFPDCNGVVCNRIKWAQPPTFNPESPHPECFWGWDELSIYGPLGPIVADDWACTDGQPVSDVHWWGSYLEWEGIDPPVIAPEFFHLGIWTDQPDGPFSHPDLMIWQQVVPREFLSERPVACDFHPQFMANPDGCFKYDFRMDDPLQWFIQDDACNVFWLSIAGIYSPEPLPGCPCNGDVDNNGIINFLDATVVIQHIGCDTATGGLCAASDVNCDGIVHESDVNIVTCQEAWGFPNPACCAENIPFPWGWKTREHFFNDDAVRIFEPFEPVPGIPFLFGEPIEDLQGATWDTAFVLTTVGCPVADPVTPEVFTSPCTTDADCENLAVCRGGLCYVPRNKYLGFSPGNAGVTTAIRVTLDTSTLFPGMEGESWWVQPHDPGDPAEVYRLGCTPHYQDWGTATPVIYVGDIHITPGAEYSVQVVDADCDPADPGSYSTETLLPTPGLWGDCIGDYDSSNSRWRPPQGSVNLVDVQAAVFAFQNSPLRPPDNWVDLDPDPPNGVVNLVDAQRIAIAFSTGSFYPYAGPPSCP